MPKDANVIWDVVADKDSAAIHVRKRNHRLSPNTSGGRAELYVKWLSLSLSRGWGLSSGPDS